MFTPHPNARKDNGYDRANSTFRHHIKMLDGSRLDGYSKTLAYSEKTDKLEVLMAVINRIWFKSGYNRKAEYMELYWNNGPVSKDHPRLLTLTPQSYHLEAEMLTFGAIAARLKDMYAPSPIRKHVKSINDLFDVAKIEAAEKEEREGKLAAAQLFSPALASDPYAIAAVFKDVDGLIAYCARLIEQGQPQGKVGWYYRKMLENYPTVYAK
jgi:hypothetical protein